MLECEASAIFPKIFDVTELNALFVGRLFEPVSHTIKADRKPRPSNRVPFVKILSAALHHESIPARALNTTSRILTKSPRAA
jgi:hypothetical protein